MSIWKKFLVIIQRPPWRTVAAAFALIALALAAYGLWSPGADIRDGRHDLGSNGLWLQHGWLGNDDWFVRNGKTNLMGRFRDRAEMDKLARLLSRHHIKDVFPHLCPVSPRGEIPQLPPRQLMSSWLP